MEHKLEPKPQSPHESLADRIMNDVSYEEIPEFLRCLHQELKNRFSLMADEAEKEASFRSKLYTNICLAFEHEVPLPKAAR